MDENKIEVLLTSGNNRTDYRFDESIGINANNIVGVLHEIENLNPQPNDKSTLLVSARSWNSLQLALVDTYEDFAFHVITKSYSIRDNFFTSITTQ